mgnify:CR=1 FL=1
MNVTINDIARATGLSTATISKYINHKKIREENRREYPKVCVNLQTDVR